MRLQDIIAYSPDQPRDDHGRFGSGTNNDAVANFQKRITQINNTPASIIQLYNSVVDKQAADRNLASWQTGESTGGELPIQQQSAIRDYAGFGFARVNGYLRAVAAFKQAPEMGPHGACNTCEALDKVTAAPLPVDLELFRGASLSNSAIEKMTPGSVISDAAYVSTSMDAVLPTRFVSGDEYSVLFRINAPKGTPGFALGQHAGAAEQEVLLPRGARFRVDSVSSASAKQVFGDTLKSYSSTLVDKRYTVVGVTYLGPPASPFARKQVTASSVTNKAGRGARFVWQSGDITVQPKGISAGGPGSGRHPGDNYKGWMHPNGKYTYVSQHVSPESLRALNPRFKSVDEAYNAGYIRHVHEMNSDNDMEMEHGFQYKGSPDTDARVLKALRDVKDGTVYIDRDDNSFDGTPAEARAHMRAISAEGESLINLNIAPIPTFHPPSSKNPQRVPQPMPFDGWRKGASKAARENAKGDMYTTMQRLRNVAPRPVITQTTQYQALLGW